MCKATRVGLHGESQPGRDTVNVQCNRIELHVSNRPASDGECALQHRELHVPNHPERETIHVQGNRIELRA